MGENRISEVILEMVSMEKREEAVLEVRATIIGKEFNWTHRIEREKTGKHEIL